VDLKELDSGIDPTIHWYYKSKALLLQDLASHSVSTVSDVGAGSMFFSREIARRTNAHTVWAIDSNYAEEYQEEIGDAKIVAVRVANVETSMSSLLMFMDVIEHVKNPVDFLQIYVTQVAVGTQFFVTAPAFQFMWSQHDEYLGHFRRYTKSSLVAELELAGLHVDRVGYYYCSLFPLIWIQRKILRTVRRKPTGSSLMTKQSRLLNSVFYRLMKLEFRISRGYSKFPGLTVVCTASKR